MGRDGENQGEPGADTPGSLLLLEIVRRSFPFSPRRRICPGRGAAPGSVRCPGWADLCLPVEYPFMSRCYRLLALFVPLAGFLTCLPRAPADEKLKDITCRSVHLFYAAAEGLAYYKEVTIDQSAEGTYFMVCG